MTSETEAKIALVYAALRERQARNEAPMPGKVTHEYLARLSQQIGQPLCANTFRKDERRILAKLRKTPLAIDALDLLRRSPSGNEHWHEFNAMKTNHAPE